MTAYQPLPSQLNILPHIKSVLIGVRRSGSHGSVMHATGWLGALLLTGHINEQQFRRLTAIVRNAAANANNPGAPEDVCPF